MKGRYLRIIIIAGVSALVVGITLFFFTQDYFKTEEISPNELLLQQKDAWRKLMKEQTAEAVYTQVLTKAETEPRTAHVFMHLVGELLYEEEGLTGLNVCDGSYGFGCYHGFFNAAIYAEGIEILPDLEAACIAKYGTIDTRCQHGLGHGLLVYTGYDHIIDALNLCASIGSQPTGGCTGGVFMEYNFHVMEKPGGDYYRPLGTDPHAPCPELPESFQASCYQELPQWWAKHFSNDYAKMGLLCSVLIKGTPQFDSCYQGIGNTISEQSMYNYENIVESCAQMPDQSEQALCREGATWQLIGRDGADRESYILLCESLSEQKRDACMSLVDAW